MDFFQYLLVFLGVGLISVFLFVKLRLGPILGYFIAGILIGPFGFGFIHEAEFLKEVSELGLVFFLFLIGLELSPRRIWHMRRAVFVLGPAQVLVSALAISAVAYFWASSWIEAMIIGLAFSLSSTAIGMQILSEKGEVTSPEGQDSLGILIFQDLIVIPILAVIAPHESFSFEQLGISLGTIILVIFGGVFIVPKALGYLAKEYRRELFVAVSLFLVVGVAVIMRSVGLSMALGAFLAGALLANSEFRHEIEADIEPFKALLFGLFFMTLGVSLDLQVLRENLFVVLLSTVGLLSLKTLANFAALWGTRLSSFIRAARIAPLLSQGGEFAFVLFALSAQIGFVSRDTATLCLGIGALSMALTPLWFKFSLQFFRSCHEVAQPGRSFDVELQNPQVIIAGYGRFGQIIHRILRLHQIPVTILEADSVQVDAVRRYGTKVFYGDATRLDLLQTAGAASAKLFVLAIDKPLDSIKTAEVLKSHFPTLQIFARARNREHSMRLMELGIPQKYIVRETLHSSLQLSENILLHLGMAQSLVSQTIQSFTEHDAQLLAGQRKYLGNEEELIRFTAASTGELQKIFESDAAQLTRNESSGPNRQDIQAEY